MNSETSQENPKPLPNATASLVLGIVSVSFAFACGLIGVVSGIIGLVLSNKDKKLYESDPSLYMGYNNSKAGRITSIIGICIGSFFFLIWIVYFIVIGAVLLYNL